MAKRPAKSTVTEARNGQREKAPGKGGPTLKVAPGQSQPVPVRDIAQHPVLLQAMNLLTDKETDRVLVKDFLTACMVELKANKARIKVAAPASLATPGKCYISNFPDPIRTIWQNGAIVDHLNQQQCDDQKIPPC